MYDCYIASGWFNENQARDLENIKTTLDELGVNYFHQKMKLLQNQTHRLKNKK